MVKAVFLDRDGVINANLERDGKPVAPRTLAEFRILPGVVEAARRLKDAGFLLIVVTNQPDVRNGITPQATMEAMHAEIRRLLPIDDFMICLHADADQCNCRKPKPGLILQAAAKHGIDLPASTIVGDRWRDILAGQAAGCRTIFVDYGYVQDRPAAADRTVKSLAEAAAIILGCEPDAPVLPTDAPFKPNTGTERDSAKSAALVAVALIALWFGGTTLALYWKHSQLLIGFDGGYMLNLAQRQFELHLPLFSASMDWFQGLGDLFFAVNFRLLPSFIAASFFTNTTVVKVVIYEIVLCELSFAIVLFGISLGASRTVAVAAALVTCLAFMPFAHPTLIYGILPLIPYMGSLISGALIVGAAFLRFGRRPWLSDLPYALIVLALLAWLVLVSITNILLAAPFLLLCAVSGTIAAANSAERRRKIGLFAVAAVFLMATGPAVYLASIILDTAAVTFPEELANNRASFYFASILFHWNHGAVGPILMIFGIAGAAVAALDTTRRTLRVFAITLLTYLGTRLTFAILIIFFDFWRGPAALYFEFFVIPLYAIFAAVFWERLLESIWHSRGWPLPQQRHHYIRLVTAAVVLALVLAGGTSRRGYGFPYPPEPNQITSTLAQETGLHIGSEFRGRTVDTIGRSVDRTVDWLTLHDIDNALASEIGNELRLVGLNYFGIPGLFEYTPTISPFFYVVTSRLLADRGDQQMRNVIVLREINPRILAMLGVRFVITDKIYNGTATLRTSIATKDRRLFLYEIPSPNIGNYSPTVASNVKTATDGIARLGDANFDPTREVIADIPDGAAGLVSARNAKLNFYGQSLRVSADSDGRSMLLLPLEFSRCLQAQTVGDNPPPVLFRANLVETGILFSRRLDAMLSIRTGAFLNAACRLHDLLDARALRVGDVPPITVQAHSRGS
jgi:D-glycero-D-manno-heptose 1,7-bisphosphate phosphatase